VLNGILHWKLCSVERVKYCNWVFSNVNTFYITGLSDCVLALGFEKMSRGSLKNTVSIIKCLKHTIFYDYFMVYHNSTDAMN